MIQIKLDEAVKIAKKYFETSFGPYEDKCDAKLDGSIWNISIKGKTGSRNAGLRYIVWVECFTGQILNDKILTEKK